MTSSNLNAASASVTSTLTTSKPSGSSSSSVKVLYFASISQVLGGRRQNEIQLSWTSTPVGSTATYVKEPSKDTLARKEEKEAAENQVEGEQEMGKQVESCTLQQLYDYLVWCNCNEGAKKEGTPTTQNVIRETFKSCMLAKNEEMIPKNLWSLTALRNGDTIAFIPPVSGG